MMIYRIQPSEHTDQITEDGQELKRLPYPFYADEDGMVQRQDFWRGKVYKVVGFVGDLARQEVDLLWSDALKEPEQVPGMYLITITSFGDVSTHVTAVKAFTQEEE
jgi:hypothetical protein